MDADKAWVASDTSEEHEGFLIGNRSGLEILKKAIEQALKDGETPVLGVNSEFSGVRVVEKDPRPPEAGFFGQAGCVLIILFCLFVFILGLNALPELFGW